MHVSMQHLQSPSLVIWPHFKEGCCTLSLQLSLHIQRALSSHCFPMQCCCVADYTSIQSIYMLASKSLNCIGFALKEKSSSKAMRDDSSWMSNVLALSSHSKLEHKSVHTQWESVQFRDQGKDCSDENAFHMVCARVIWAIASAKVVILHKG